MIVAFDIDGVIADFHEFFNQCINERFPEKAIPKGYRPTDWWYTEVLKPAEIKPALEQFQSMTNPWLDMEELPGAGQLRQHLATFAFRGIDVYYVTSRMKSNGGTTLSQTRTWLRRHGLTMANTSLIVVGSMKEKQKVYEACGISMSIDDNIESVQGAVSLHKHTACLLDQKWNKQSTLPRVTSVEEFCQAVLQNAAAGQLEWAPAPQQ